MKPEHVGAALAYAAEVAQQEHPEEGFPVFSVSPEATKPLTLESVRRAFEED